MTLDEVRVNIDHIDTEMKELFLERMALSDQVARVKAETGDAVLKPDRETAMVDRLTKDVAPEIKAEYAALIRKIIAVSRMYQYGRILQLKGGTDLTGKMSVLPEHNRVKVMFQCENRCGALAGILSAFSDRGVNITEIHSSPDPEREGNYAFYVEFAGNLMDQNIQSLIFQLKSETEYFQITDSYAC